MKYGFIIDNRKCIGCHACTTACKSEHDVAIGVNRTWVKYIEKGVFPDSRRLFSVMRCNHCTDAPCVTICPVEALFIRDDGIVDFDNRRCIACKSCTQACPYDAIYIDPKTNTAAKCNYCAHRVDIGLEPACVNVCPEEAIISGDMDNPNSKISKLLSRQQVSVRKPEKGTKPNLFYIDGDSSSLTPEAGLESADNMWNAQTLGVGHYAKEAEKLAFSNSDVIEAIQQMNRNEHEGDKLVNVLKGKPRKAYQAPDKGILWGWEVSAYIWTKAISAGAFLVAFISRFFVEGQMGFALDWVTVIIGLVFLALTGALLVKDLDRPDRFLNVLLRPQWKSWLVRGGYAITVFGGLLSLLAVSYFLGWTKVKAITMWLTAATAIIVAIYTAFLLAQAKGRDFWQSPTLSIHMLVHSLMAGGAAFGIVTMVLGGSESWLGYLKMMLILSIAFNLGTLLLEMITPHPTSDAKQTAHSILSGRYKNKFWFGIILLGNILPIGILIFLGTHPISLSLAGAFILLGVYLTEHVWVEAPQRIHLV